MCENLVKNIFEYARHVFNMFLFSAEEKKSSFLVDQQKSHLAFTLSAKLKFFLKKKKQTELTLNKVLILRIRFYSTFFLIIHFVRVYWLTNI